MPVLSSAAAIVRASLRAGALALVLTTGVQAHGARPAQGNLALQAEVRAIFEDPGRQTARSELRALGSAAAPAAWALLSGHGRPEDLDLDTRACRELLRETLPRWPAEEVLPALTQQSRPSTPLGERLVLLDFLAWTDSAEAVEATFQVLASFSALELQSHRVTRQLESTLARLIDDHPHRIKRLAPFLEQLPPGPLGAVFDYLSQNSSAESTRLLYSTARRNPETEYLVLESLARQQELSAFWVPEEFLPIARRAVDSKDPLEQRLAISILGKLRDEESFDHIVEFLEGEDNALRRVALASVQNMTGLKRDWTTRRWWDWHRRERARIEADVQRARGIQTFETGEAVMLIRDLTTHQFFAASAVKPLGAAMNHPDVLVRTLACDGLARMQHSSALPLLIAALDDRESVIREHAQAALVAASGHDFGTDRRDWEDWWDGLH